MVRKCYVPDCSSEEGKEEHQGVTFHKIPMHPDIRPKWMSLCHIPDDKKNMKVIYVCSRHFLSADFCHFKGKKYMLRQGVLPSVFPWKKAVIKKTKVKKEHAVAEGDESKAEMAYCLSDEKLKIKKEIDIDNIKIENSELSESMKEELISDNTKDKCIKSEPSSSTTEGNAGNSKSEDTIKSFLPNMRIEALNFNETWNPAQVVEVDYEENEVLIHFEKYSSKYDEWICMNSSRLRPLQSKKSGDSEKYTVGEKCLASWSDGRKFPATVTKIISNDTYEVVFDDGFVKVLKSNRLAKAGSKPLQSSPLFEPVKGTKQERRNRKRKLNVAALFGKRPRTDDDSEVWTPKWENGRPVGEESVIELHDGARKSVIVPDPRLPSNWVKHLTQRLYGTSAGKWDTVIVSPEGKRFRTRSEIKTYIDAHPDLNLSENMFDFSLHKKVKKSNQNESSSQQAVPQSPAEAVVTPEENLPEEENTNSLKILLVDDAYKCPIKGCGKNFRRENLAQMHVKHYHPEYTKFLDSTPNVADLAYARTVGENLDKATGPEKPKKSAPSPSLENVQDQQQAQNKPQEEATMMDTNEDQTQSKGKDSEILKLLNNKPANNGGPKYPPGLPSSAYPDIKLKDLLKKSEGIPKRDDLNLKSLSASTARPTGIKTLLPVTRSEQKKEQNLNKCQQEQEEGAPDSHGKQTKRKRQTSEPNQMQQQQQQQLSQPAGAGETSTKETESSEQPSNYIVEGGEIIKIVQMKREEIINCTCGITEEDGLMIQCELCLCWQHAYCNNIERENQVPDKYICYICQNPDKQRSSRKYYHDQDWLKHGTLAVGSYHCKDDETLIKRFDKLKKSHDLSGALIELKDFVHTLKTKIKIAEAKNHPKLYLWSKPWEKKSLPEDVEKKEDKQDLRVSEVPKSEESQNNSVLFSLLKNSKEEDKQECKTKEEEDLDLNVLMGAGLEDEQMELPARNAPIIPQPEAAIDYSECRLNLLDHIAHTQALVEKRLDNFEEKIKMLESMDENDNDENYVKTRHTLKMLLRDLCTLQNFGQSSSL